MNFCALPVERVDTALYQRWMAWAPMHFVLPGKLQKKIFCSIVHWLFAHHRGISLKWMSRYCSLILLLGLAALPWWCNSGRWCALQGWSLCRLDLSTAVRLVEAAFVSYFVFRIRERHVVNIIYMCIYCAWAELLSYSAGPCAASLGQLTCGNEGEVLLYHFVHLNRQPSNRRPTF